MTKVRAFFIAAFVAATPALAQELTVGQYEYTNSCAYCHGASGRGDGPLVSFLTAKLPDLTQLQKSNGGVFPVARVYEVIDGSNAIAVHGTREMPAWGLRYAKDAPEALGYYDGPGDREMFARARVLALVEYISTLQVQ